jgi:K+ channel tetramerisation domain.
MESKPNEVVKISIGGTKFYTTLKTLTSRPGTYISHLFSNPEQLLKDDEGFYFIDRDGSYFIYVLNYLRGHKLNIPWNTFEATRIIDEFNYYGLDILKD